MTHEELKNHLKEEYGGYALFEPEHYDEAIVGITENGRVVYSYDKLAETLILHDGMSYEDAIEWIDYNTIRTIPYMGEFKPVVILEFPEYDDKWLVGASTDGEPVYSHDNVPEEPVRHECIDDYWMTGDDEERELPEPIIIYPLEKQS